MDMMWIVAIFGSVIALVIISLGFIMINPDSFEKMSVFEDTASKAVKTSKSTVDDISKLNASSIIDPIVEKRDEVIDVITNNSSGNQTK